MTPGQLHAAYPGEYQSWKDSKSRCRNKGWPWASEWEPFKGFLRSMGPKTPAQTLDREDNAVQAYGPGLCRWADKHTQNNNKSDNIKIVVPLTEEEFSAQKLAKLHGVHVKAVYKWISNHYSDLELIAGKKSKPLHALSMALSELAVLLASLRSGVEPIKSTAPDVLHIPHLEVAWLQAMHAVFPGECSVLTAAERGMLKTFAKMCSEGCLADQAVEVLDHTIKNWIDYAKTAENDHSACNIPMRPTIGFLIKYPRPALNLWLRANDLEMKDGFPQLKASSPKAPLLSEPVKKGSVIEQWPPAPPPAPEPRMTWEELMADPHDDL
jgi:hypothetical protein